MESSNVAYGAVGSLVMLVLLFLVMELAIHRAGLKKQGSTSVLEIVDGYYSLTNLQIFCWTRVILEQLK